MTLIMAVFIAILLEPIEKYLKKKSKINDILAISLSIVFVVFNSYNYVFDSDTRNYFIFKSS